MMPQRTPRSTSSRHGRKARDPRIVSYRQTRILMRKLISHSSPWRRGPEHPFHRSLWGPAFAGMTGKDPTCARPNLRRRHAIKRAQLVAVGIAKISKIHLAGSALADAGRVLDRRAA